MNANRSERLRRRKEFEANQSQLRANQIETMIAEFDRICIDLGREIEAEEMHARIDDPAHCVACRDAIVPHRRAYPDDSQVDQKGHGS